MPNPLKNGDVAAFALRVTPGRGAYPGFDDLQHAEQGPGAVLNAAGAMIGALDVVPVARVGARAFVEGADFALRHSDEAAGLVARFLADESGAPKSLDDAVRATINATYEQAPGDGTGLLPNVVAGSPELRRQFTDAAEWIDSETGVGVIYRDMGYKAHPTVRGFGVFENSAGNVEVNPSATVPLDVPIRNGLVPDADLTAVTGGGGVEGTDGLRGGLRRKLCHDMRIGRQPTGDEAVRRPIAAYVGNA